MQIRSNNWYVPALILFLTGLTGRAQTTEASIVTIYCRRSSGSSQGTGFVFGSQGLIVTAYHVVEDANRIVVRDTNYRALTNITVEFIDSGHDLAILKSTESPTLPGLKPATSVSPQAEIEVAGSPRGLPRQILFGRVTSMGLISSLQISSAKGRQIFAKDIDVYPVDVTIYNGMSGAPVLSKAGVIGVFSGSYDEGRGIGWAIPTKYVLDLLSTTKLSRQPQDMGVWPTLSLMSTSWVSLVRSYSKQFSADQIANLEILEGAFRWQKGVWNSKADTREDVFISFGKCTRITHQELTLSVDAVDQDRGRLTGFWRGKVSIEAQLTPDQTSIDLNVSSLEAQTASCNQAAGSGDFELKADAFLMVDDIREYSEDDPVFTVNSKVTDCNGTLCKGEFYGPAQPGQVEKITDTRMKWGTAILDKSQQ